MKIGVLVRFFAERNYGFILNEEDGTEYFFHRCDWIDTAEPTRYAKVAFELGRFNGRIKAVKVRRHPLATETGADVHGD